MSNCRKDVFVRRSKREEKITRQSSEEKAFEVAEEWAAEIKRLGLADRFGMQMRKAGRWNWDVYLIDRSIPKNDGPKNKGK